MEKVKRYEMEGTILEIPVYWDERSQKYLEDYSSLIEKPAYTREGRPILLTIEDACPHAAPVDHEPTSIDCGACRYYRQIPGSLLGVCKNEAMRSGAKPAPTDITGKEEEKP